MLSRAIKAQAICEEAGLINTQSLEKAKQLNFMSEEDQIYSIQSKQSDCSPKNTLEKKWGKTLDLM